MDLRSNTAVFSAMSYGKRSSSELPGEIKHFYSPFSIFMFSLCDPQVTRFCCIRAVVLGADTTSAKNL